MADQLLGILFWQKSKKNPEIDIIKLENKIIEIIGKDSIELAERNSDIEAIIFATESSYSDNKVLEKTIKELLSRIKKTLLEARRIDIRKELEFSEGDELLTELHEISKKIEMLNSGSVDIYEEKL